MNKTILLALISVASFAVQTSAHANLVENGDFSLGATGWTITSPNHFYSFHLNSLWDGAYVNNPDTFSQTLNTIPGQEYTLSYTFSTLNSQPGLIFESTWGGVLEQTITTANTNPVTYTFANLIATSNATTLSFISGNQQFYNELTNVSVTSLVSTIPVPASVWMFASGLLGLGTLRKKVRA